MQKIKVSDAQRRSKAASEAMRRTAVDDARLLEALREIEVICTESAADCRKRMGTRVGNILVVVRRAIAKASA